MLAMSCNDVAASRGSMVLSMTALAVERSVVVPVGKLGGSAIRIARVGKLADDPLQIALRRGLVAGERPTLREAGEIFAAIVLGELVKNALPDRERGFEIRGG